MKMCNRCKEVKELTAFYRDSAKKDGLSTLCKECKLNVVRKYKSKNRSLLARKSNEYRKENLEECRKRERAYSASHYNERKLRVKEFAKKYPEKINAYKKKWADKNIDKVRGYAIKCMKKRRANPLENFKLKCRKMMHSSLEGLGKRKDSLIFQTIGCSPEHLKCYLEANFKDGMSWDNYGKWQIDHIKPLVLAETFKDVIIMSHYSNLQPLWAKENMEKGTSYGNS